MFFNKWPKKKEEEEELLKFYPVSIFELSNNSQDSKAFVLPTWLKSGEWVFTFFLKIFWPDRILRSNRYFYIFNSYFQYKEKIPFDLKEKAPGNEHL